MAAENSSEHKSLTGDSGIHPSDDRPLAGDPGGELNWKRENWRDFPISDLVGKACRRVEKSDAAELRELIEKMAELALEARVVGWRRRRWESFCM